MSVSGSVCGRALVRPPTPQRGSGACIGFIRWSMYPDTGYFLGGKLCKFNVLHNPSISQFYDMPHYSLRADPDRFRQIQGGRCRRALLFSPNTLKNPLNWLTFTQKSRGQAPRTPPCKQFYIVIMPPQRTAFVLLDVTL